MSYMLCPTCGEANGVVNTTIFQCRCARERAAQHLKREQGWLIERRDRPAVEWAFVTADKFISWTPRSLEALRFARKEEAEVFAECAEFSEKVFVTEHIWMEPMRVQTDFHSVNLSTGEKTRSIVGDGECRHETVGPLKREQEPAPGVTPEMMSNVFAQSVQRKDSEHNHIYDHRIAAELLNKLLAAQPPQELVSRKLRKLLRKEWLCPLEQKGKTSCLDEGTAAVCSNCFTIQRIEKVLAACAAGEPEQAK